MVLHLGLDGIIPFKEIFFMFKYSPQLISMNKECFEQIEAKSNVVYIGNIDKSQVKSVVYGKVLGVDYLFYSPISVSTLLKRIKEGNRS